MHLKLCQFNYQVDAIRTALNLKDNEGLFKKEVTITGKLETYFSVPGLKSPTEYSLVEATPEVVLATDLIISEYIEGTSFNKAIELYNGTGAEIDLTQYTLEHYNNSGSATVGTTTTDKSLPLVGTLAAGETYVVSRSDADPVILAAVEVSGLLDTAKNVINFNGNDQVVLKKNGVVVDSIGQVGSVENTLADVSLVRNSNVLTGDTIIDDAFDWSLEWTNLGTNNFSNIGTHTMDGGGTAPVETKVSEVKASPASSAVEAGTKITLSTSTTNTKIYYTVDGTTEPTTADTAIRRTNYHRRGYDN